MNENLEAMEWIGDDWQMICRQLNCKHKFAPVSDETETKACIFCGKVEENE